MRGDSLRDFYAKTLAVLGLGVLAATGAAVDYWPVGEDWATVSAVAGLAPDAFRPIQSLPPDIPAPPRVTRAKQPAMFVVADVLNEPVAEEAPLVVAESAPIPESFVSVGQALPELLLVETIDLEPAPVVEAPTEESRRLVGDAMRRTRESLGAARMFLSDAFSGVVGALRKASPFFATGVVAPY